MIIIPTYNERKNIRPLVSRIRKVLPEIAILFVDDNSPDGTGEEIRNLQKEDPNISLLPRPEKLGFASAYLDGFHLALVGNVEFVVTMDGDLSHPAEKLPELIEAATSGTIAVGSRYTKHGAVSNWSLKRKILSRFANLYARNLVGLPLRDATSGFMAIPLDKLRGLDLSAIQNQGYAFLIELKSKLGLAGHQFMEVPIVFEERKEGESKIGRSIILEGVRYPARIFFQRQLNHNFHAWLIFFVSFVVYVLTLPHTIFFGDSPEFMASVATLGIPHPPGYPGFMLLAKPFTWLPVGSLEFRIGLLSAVSAALCLVVIFQLLRKIIKNDWIAVATVLILGFSNIFWSQALMAKVYMSMLLVLFLVIYLLDKFLATGKKSYLLWSLFLWGFGITLHEILGLFLPILFFYLGLKFWRDRVPQESLWRQKIDSKSIFIGIFLFALGMSAFLYLPVRAGQPGIYDFSRIFRISHPEADFGQFLNYVKRADYRDFGPALDLKNKIHYLAAVVVDLWQQFNILLAAAVVGLFALYQKSKKFFIIFLAVFLLNTLGIIFTRNSPWGGENDYLYSFYYLPAYAVTAIWIGLGLNSLYEIVRWRFPEKISESFIAAAMLAPVLFCALNFSPNNLSHFTFVDDYSTQILRSLPPNALLLIDYENASSDTMIFGLHFQQVAAKVRPDVALLTVYDIYPNINFNILAGVFGLADQKKARYYLVKYMIQSADYQNRPVYTTFIVDDLSPKFPNWFSASNGLVYKFYANAPKNSEFTADMTLDYKKDQTVLESDLYGRALLSQYFYSQAAWFADHQQSDETTRNLIEGIKYDDRLKIDNASLRAHRVRVLGKVQI